MQSELEDGEVLFVVDPVFSLKLNAAVDPNTGDLFLFLNGKDVMLWPYKDLEEGK